jgi:tryptophan 2,3-dioxygenase
MEDNSEEKRRNEYVQSLRSKGGAYYSSYLKIPELLSLQQPLSRSDAIPNQEAHDEMLFIIVHQTYELWFKQMLHEIDSVRDILSHVPMDDRGIVKCVSRLQRVIEIQKVMVQQLTILETMSAMDFLAFRDLLFPASGFQSMQFRLVENKLGLLPSQRMTYGSTAGGVGRGYCSYLRESDAETVSASEKNPSLFDLVEAWLERTPFMVVSPSASTSSTSSSADEPPSTDHKASVANHSPADVTGSSSVAPWLWWTHFQEAVSRMLQMDDESFLSNPRLNEAEIASARKEVAATREHFMSVLDAEKYEAARKRGERRLSHGAMQAALLITLYHEEPILQLPFLFLQALLDIDEHLTTWRYRHALMVHRMIGIKLGTGGSAGYYYLRATADRHKIFGDLFNLSTFLVPHRLLPSLPADVRARLSFAFGVSTSQTSSITQPLSPIATTRPHPLPASSDTGTAKCPFGHS